MDRNYRVVVILIICVTIVFLLRLFQLQVLDKKYIVKAADNALREITEHPARGLVYDRNDSLLVYNDAAYDLMVIPNQMKTI